mgnify:CR=1 FL=1
MEIYKTQILKNLHGIEHRSYTREYTDLKHHQIKLLDEPTVENVNIELTNVKKQFTFNLNVFNSKYTNEKIAGVHFRVKAYDESGNERFEKYCRPRLF